MAAICEFLGAVLLGASVTSTIKCDSIHIQSANCMWIRVVLDKTPHSGIGRALRGPTRPTNSRVLDRDEAALES